MCSGHISEKGKIESRGKKSQAFSIADTQHLSLCVHLLMCNRKAIVVGASVSGG